MALYQWLQFSTARQQLGQRLSDPNGTLWSDAERGFYVQQALRVYNSLTWQWRTDFTYNTGNVWNSLALLPGSPRLRTIKDTYCYQLLEYMLLEPSSGGTWSGTNQFSISDLSQALQRRRDEMIKITNCNQSLLTGVAAAPNTRLTTFPDTVIDIARGRFLPAVTGSPNTLYRDDTVAQEFYEAPLYQITPGTPQTFSLSSEPPISWQVDIPPSQPGTYEAVVLNSGTAFNPPASTLIGIPDDFAWVLIWGALADLLGRESEATDRARSAYCVPLNSEILTRKGWRKYSDIKCGEDVLGYNAVTGMCEWTPLLAVNVLRQREVFTYDCRSMSVRCTEDHRWVFKRRKNRRAKGISPVTEVSIQPLKDEFTDSVFVQAAHAPSGPGLGSIAIDEYLLRGKGVEMVLQMTSGERRAFILGMLYGEGNHTKGRLRKSTVFSQNEGPVLDAMKLACALEGIPTSDSRRVKRDNGCCKFTLLLRTIRARSFKKIPKETTVEDVWCPTTGLGTWVMRQGRNITITGNCLKRYQDGLKLMLKTPWIELAKVNGAAVSVDSIYAADRYMPEWDSSPMTFGPCVIVGGIDFLAAPTNAGIGVTCLGNAPIPVLDGDYVQVSRDNFDAVLDLAQVFAMFKLGGLEFQQVLQVEARAIQAAVAENVRLKSMGCFSDILDFRGQAEYRDRERYATASKGGEG